MSDAFVRLQLWLTRHRLLVLGLISAFAAGALFLGSRLTINEDFTAMLPVSDPAIAEQVEAMKHIRQTDRLFVDVHATSPDPERLAQAADVMAEALRQIPNLTDLRSGFDPAALQAVFAQLQSQLTLLLGSNDLSALEARLEAPALRKRLEWLKQAMTQPQGLMFKEVAQADPAGLSDLIGARLRALQPGVGDARVVEGRLTSADGRHVLLTAVPVFRASEVDKGHALIERVLRAARETEDRFPGASIKIAVTGGHRVASDNATMIRADTRRTGLLATVAVAALMFLAYRRRWLSILGLLPTAFGALAAMVVFYWEGDPVSAVALGCGSILIGVTVDYGIFILYHHEDAPPPDRQRLGESVAQLAPTLIFGALTSMAAFFVMGFSPVSGQRQLGLFGAVGVAASAAFALLVLPLLIPLGSVRSPRPLPLTRVLDWLLRWRERHARLVLPLMLLFSALCVAGLLRLRFDGDLARLNGITPDTRQDEETIRAAWGKALSLTTVVVSGVTFEEALQKNEQLAAALQDLQARGMIETFSSVAPFWPSEKTQRSQAQAWSSFWTDARRRDFSNTLAGVSASLGFRVAAFQGFLERLATPAQPQAADALKDSPLGRLLSDYWQEKDGRVCITTLVKLAPSQEFQRLRTALHQAVPGVMLLNKAALFDEMSRLARQALPAFAAAVAFLNALLLFVLLGRLELVVLTLLPMATGILWTLGMLGLAGLPIDISNVVFVVFVIGVGGDYSLFLLCAEIEPLRGHAQRTAATAGAVSVCALTTLLGVGVLVTARHPALFSVGLTALLGISLSLVATLLLVPACVVWLRRREQHAALEASDTIAVTAAGLRRWVTRLYRYQGPYVSQFVYWKTLIDPLFRAVDAALPPQGTVLDLGCGYGALAHWLTFASPGRWVIGVDADPRKLRVAQATARYTQPRVAFELRDILSWEEYPACDHVLLCDVLHYFPQDWKVRVLQRAYRALRPGGSLVLRDAARAETWRHRAVAWAERWAVWIGANRTAHGLHFDSAHELATLLREAGFSRIEVWEGAGRGSNLLMIAWKTMEGAGKLDAPDSCCQPPFRKS